MNKMGYIYLSEFPRKSPTVVNYCLFSSKFSLFFMQLCSLLIFQKVYICFAKFYKGLWYNTSSTAFVKITRIH